MLQRIAYQLSTRSAGASLTVLKKAARCAGRGVPAALTGSAATNDSSLPGNAWKHARTMPTR